MKGNINIMIYSINEGIIFSTKNSRTKVVQNYKRLQTIIESYIRLNSKRLDILEKLFSIIKSTNKNCEKPNAKFEDLNKDWKSAEEEYIKSVYWDPIISKKAWAKWLRMGFFNRADLKNADLSSELKEFINKAIEGGEYHKNVESLKSRASKLIKDWSDFTNKAVEESKKKPVSESYLYMLKVFHKILYSSRDSIWATEEDIKSINDIKVKKVLGYFESIQLI